MPAPIIPAASRLETSDAKGSAAAADNVPMMSANGGARGEVVMLRLTVQEKRALEQAAAAGHRTAPGHLRYLLALDRERTTA